MRRILNKITPTINIVFSYKILEILLLGAIFFLPVSLFINNLLFTVFFIAFNFRLLLAERISFFSSIRINALKILVFCSPLFLAVFGSIYTENLEGAQKDIGRLIPLVLTIPLVFHKPFFFFTLLNKMIYTLAIGCLVSACICWGLSIIEIFENNDSISDLFSQAYAYHFLSEKVGIHTPYLGLFVSSSIFFLLYQFLKNRRRKLKALHIIWAIILFIFLLNLLARTALFILIFGTLILLVHKKKYIFLLLIVLMVSFLSGLAFFQDQNFIRDRVFKSINIFEEQTVFSKKDDRFTRFSASIEVFNKFPILGPGTANENKYRKEIYFRNRDSKAYNENYNAHNQLLEYLSTYGIMGGTFFLATLYILLKETFKSKDSLIFFLVFSFIFAGLTESILERSWGISFYILVLFLVFSRNRFAHEAK